MRGEYLTFFKEVSRHFSTIGSIAPSSPALARRMLKPILNRSKGESSGLRILEVGPGTGPFTRRILRRMRGADHLTVCEIHLAFLESLRKKLQGKDYFERNRDRVEFYGGPVQQLFADNPNAKFDVIVCSLPFNMFPSELVDELFSLFRKHTAAGGSFVFFEYLGLRNVGQLLRSSDERARLKAVGEVKDKWIREAEVAGEVNRTITLLNFPPALSVHMQYT